MRQHRTSRLLASRNKRTACARKRNGRKESHMKPRSFVSKVLLSVAFVSAFGLPFIIAGQSSSDRKSRGFDNVIKKNAGQLVEQGRQIFRFNTFGDEEFWG